MKKTTNSMRRSISLLLLVSLAMFGMACGDEAAEGLNTLFTFTNIGAGEQCPDGGVQVDSGLDSNNNGVLEATEITNSTVLCNGPDGAAQDGAPGATASTESMARLEPTGLMAPMDKTVMTPTPC